MHGAATQLKSAAKENANNRYAPPQAQKNVTDQRFMVGASAFTLSGRFNAFPTKLYSSKVTCRHPSSPRLAGNKGSSKSWLESCGRTQSQTLSSSLTVFNCHSSSCLLAKQGLIGATIWHVLLPSSCLFVDSARKLMRGSSARTEVAALATSGTGLISGGKLDGLCRKFPGTTAFGSWNVAGDARPARWLHDSTWLLFGFCSCFSAAGAAAAASSSTVVAFCEANPGPVSCAETEIQIEAKGSHGKTVHKEFSVIGIPGDGRCLFRAVGHGVCTKQGKPTSDEDSQRELADELRSKVVDELIKRRSESEWFIEGDFDQYTQRMREPHVWGGEPELLMLSHVLQLPITVYMSDRSSNGLIAIAEYGQEYGKENPIRVLYHGFGHYDALQTPGAAAAQSRL